MCLYFMTDTELILDAKARLGEGPVWDVRSQVLWWVDILPGHLHRYNPTTNTDTTYAIGQMVGTVVPCASGGVMLAVEDGFAHYDPQTETLTPVALPEADKSDHRFNDGKTDPAGRFWAGTMPLSEDTFTGAVYRLDTQRQVTRMIENVAISNGIAWTQDAATMYYIDSLTRNVVAYDYDNEAGTIQHKRRVITVPPELGWPDGMAIDSNGHLWIAHYGTQSVICWNPQTGRQVNRIELPVSNPTACAFGGESLTDLYITSAIKDHTDAMHRQQPHAGGVFKVKLDVPGTTFPPFRG
jgi:sugar lactone lactonase YvrE